MNQIFNEVDIVLRKHIIQAVEFVPLKEFKFTNEIEVVYMIQEKIQLQQQPFFMIYYLENGIKLRKRCLNLEKKD